MNFAHKKSNRNEAIQGNSKPFKTRNTSQGNLIKPTSAAYAETLPISSATMKDKLETHAEYISSEQS